MESRAAEGGGAARDTVVRARRARRRGVLDRLPCRLRCCGGHGVRRCLHIRLVLQRSCLKDSSQKSGTVRVECLSELSGVRPTIWAQCVLSDSGVVGRSLIFYTLIHSKKHGAERPLAAAPLPPSAVVWVVSTVHHMRSKCSTDRVNNCPD